jgi:hypothetical protein
MTTAPPAAIQAARGFDDTHRPMAGAIPLDAKLTRDRAAQALTAEGLPTSAATLATLASRGGGPPYQRYGRLAIYTWGPTLEWAMGRMSRPARSAIERKVAEGC